MTDVNFMVEQIEGETEAWKIDHKRAMECRDVEDLVRRGIGLYHVIRMADEAWSRKVQCGEVRFEAERARQFHRQYEWWIVPCDELLRLIEEMEREFGSVKGSQEFREARAEVRSYLRIDVEAIIRGMENRAA